jgi:hypothetical protein
MRAKAHELVWKEGKSDTNREIGTNSRAEESEHEVLYAK